MLNNSLETRAAARDATAGIPGNGRHGRTDGRLGEHDNGTYTTMQFLHAASHSVAQLGAMSAPTTRPTTVISRTVIETPQSQESTTLSRVD